MCWTVAFGNDLTAQPSLGGPAAMGVDRRRHRSGLVNVAPLVAGRCNPLRIDRFDVMVVCCVAGGESTNELPHLICDVAQLKHSNSSHRTELVQCQIECQMRAFEGKPGVRNSNDIRYPRAITSSSWVSNDIGASRFRSVPTRQRTCMF